MIRGLFLSIALTLFSSAAFSQEAPPAGGGAASPPAAASTAPAPASTPAPAETPAPKTPSVPTPSENVLAEGKPEDAEAEKVAEGEKKPGEKDAAEEKEPEAKAPEPIKYEFKAAEGVELAPETVKEFTELLQKMPVQVPQEQAQALLDLANRHIESQVIKQYENWANLQNQWIADIKKDAEIGGKNFDLTKQVFSKALEQVFPDKKAQAEVRQALISTGAGNNPHIVRAFYRMAKGLTEGGFVGGNAPRQDVSAATRMYPNQKA